MSDGQSAVGRCRRRPEIRVKVGEQTNDRRRQGLFIARCLFRDGLFRTRRHRRCEEMR